ncbi:MAG: hypothetical protein J6R12_03990, partial [Bacteroidales bacterium]|nr:hypothetical protein [Bacteroidales bacterium]
FSPLRSLTRPSSARKVSLFPISIFRAFHYFSRLLRRLASFSVPHYFSRRFGRQSFLRKFAKSRSFQFQFFVPFTTFLASFVGSQSRMRLGKENKPWLVFFSLSFVFGRFESKLSSGLQLRIKNHPNLFYLRSPFTTFVPL